ncbi:MAG: glycosyl transferase [Candidatus Berkiellales bacterium]
MNYCTLFNSAYLSRGLALYSSLLQHAKDFHLYIFAFDDIVYQLLLKLQLPHATVISLKEFETPDLLKIKATRTTTEYCWTCTPSILVHCLEKYALTAVCYLDADLYFWNDPQVLLDEANHDSILLTEHRYTKEYDQADLSGKYCVQFMVFKNDPAGLKALYWWRDACLDWCYNRREQGKFGDQKYLDDWLDRFANVKVLTHLGGGVAPWNVQQYQIVEPIKPMLCAKESGEKFNLVFYHFHALKFVGNAVDFGRYKLSNTVIKSLYLPYVQQLLKIQSELTSNDMVSPLLNDINLHGKNHPSHSMINTLRALKHRLKGIYHVYPLAEFST